MARKTTAQSVKKCRLACPRTWGPEDNAQDDQEEAAVWWKPASQLMLSQQLGPRALNSPPPAARTLVDWLNTWLPLTWPTTQQQGLGFPAQPRCTHLCGLAEGKLLLGGLARVGVVHNSVHARVWSERSGIKAAAREDGQQAG